jgi:hypothetical protein
VEDRRLLERREDPNLGGHVQRIADEFREGFRAVDRIPEPAVSIFGSARVGEESRATLRGVSPRPASRSSPAAARA